jgi:hypothetical protein
MPDQPQNASDQEASDFFAPPERPPDKPPGRASLEDIIRHDEEAARWRRGEAPHEEGGADVEPNKPEQPARLTADQVLDRLAPPAPVNEDPVRAAALEELDREREAWQGIATGEPVKVAAEAESRFQTELQKVVDANPGLDSDEAIEAMQPIIDRVEEEFGPDYAYSPQVIQHAFEQVGGSEKFDNSLTVEEQMWAQALGSVDGRKTDDGRVELVPKGRKVNRFGF